MPTAAEIAQAAWNDKDRARRLREATKKRQAEATARRARTRAENAACNRLARSLIPEWFPGVEWTYIETEDYKDIWSSGDGYDKIKLAVLHNTTDSAKKLRIEFVRIKDWEPTAFDRPRSHREVWYTVPVNTVADVWQAKRDWDRVCTWIDALTYCASCTPLR